MLTNYRMLADYVTDELLKSKISVWAILLSAWVAQYLREVFFDDGPFILTVFILVVFDTITGTLVAIKEGKFSSKGMGGVLNKLAVILAGIGSLHAAAMYFKTANPAIGEVLFYADSVAFAFVILREVVSIQENAAKLGYPVIPPGVLSKIKGLFKPGK